MSGPTVPWHFPMTITPSDLWSRLADSIPELRYLEARDWNEHGLKGEQQQQFLYNSVKNLNL